ncbi:MULTISPECIES: endonuclease/exonuclease/phosphatase family protein [Streptomyces]|uniref:endonuclease/exonuclease/phosphatase family protein n=1 Tax=Streptomyces TaxID=1883 RepID=UPI001C4FD841|nr:MULTISPECIES: endonuclease/exonuclease/phosphatase family protein [Streptomyces]MCX4709640.1 endonuclease/exonuclease/phosphatase family protein [Streptomyces griseus]QXQ97593.1 endonuclease/exonuclease/phosphatase family protein [Streptomyces sp. WY228]
MSAKRRVFLSATGAAVALAATAAVAVAGPADRPDEAKKPGRPAAASELRVMTLNLWHGGAKVDDGLAKQLDVIKKHRPDVVGLQETSGHSAKELAEELGWDHWQSDADLGIISRFPFSSEVETSQAAAGVRIRIDEATGQEVELWTAHLGYDPYGPYDACFDEMPVEEIFLREAQSGRTPQAEAIAKDLAPKIAAADETPVLLVGDFNTPSHLDWTEATKDSHCGYGQVDWPVTKIFEDAGLKDSFREANPDPATVPGTTWSPVYPKHDGSTGVDEPQDRIDFIDYAGAKLTVKKSVSFVEGDPKPVPDQAGNAWPTDHAAVLTTFTVG